LESWESDLDRIEEGQWHWRERVAKLCFMA
jgi:hypothetical protein